MAGIMTGEDVVRLHELTELAEDALAGKGEQSFPSAERDLKHFMAAHFLMDGGVDEQNLIFAQGHTRGTLSAEMRAGVVTIAIASTTAVRVGPRDYEDLELY